MLLLGPAGSGKSDMVLRLIDRGFSLVGDDQMEVEGQVASPPPALAGLLEVRGLGLLRLPFVASARLALAVLLQRGERLPSPARYPVLDLPMVSIDPVPASAHLHVVLAFEAALGAGYPGKGAFVTGAFG